MRPRSRIVCVALLMSAGGGGRALGSRYERGDAGQRGEIVAAPWQRLGDKRVGARELIPGLERHDGRDVD
jgi:hypothetical protein